MSDRIKILPDSVANQIAAGEVVNRPASVVKELLENSIDAQAKNITLNIKDGGKVLIHLIDDGVGMSPIDARLAFDRHATSKVESVEDIYNLHTFGFRGEALASIAAVSELELLSRTAESELGTKVEISASKFISQSAVSTAVGTQMIIKNIFLNIPARRRFLDKSTTEMRHIMAEYQRVALCNPEVGFTLYNNEALTSKLPPSTLRQRVINVIGKGVAKNLLDVNVQTTIVDIEGFVGRPQGAKQSNREQFLFVNGRYFRSAYFNKAVISAYQKLIPSNIQPSYFLYLTVNPERIDVNVHPQKVEVKFADASDIWQIINAAVRESLAKSGSVPSMDFEMDESIEIPIFKERVSYKAPEIRGNPDFNPFSDGTGRADLSDFMKDYNAAAQGGEQQGRGEAMESYEESILEFVSGEYDAVQHELEIDVEAIRGDVLSLSSRHFATTTGGVLLIIDIRRAHEAVLYDKFIKMLGSGSSVSQQMLFPEQITMSLDDISLLRENMDDFSALGFDILFRDDHTVALTAMPAEISSSSGVQLIYDLLDVIRDGDPSSEIKRRHLAATISSLGSIGFGSRTMSHDEMEALLSRLMQCSNPTYTPSGVKTMISISEDEILKRMK